MARHFKGNPPKEYETLLAVHPGGERWALYLRALVPPNLLNLKLVAGEPAEGKANYWLSAVSDEGMRYILWEGKGFRDATVLRKHRPGLYEWVKQAVFFAEDRLANPDDPDLSPEIVGRLALENASPAEADLADLLG